MPRAASSSSSSAVSVEVPVDAYITYCEAETATTTVGSKQVHHKYLIVKYTSGGDPQSWSTNGQHRLSYTALKTILEMEPPSTNRCRIPLYYKQNEVCYFLAYGSLSCSCMPGADSFPRHCLRPPHVGPTIWFDQSSSYSCASASHVRALGRQSSLHTLPMECKFSFVQVHAEGKFFIILQNFRHDSRTVLDVGDYQSWTALTDDRRGQSVPRIDKPIVVRAAGTTKCPSMITVHWQSRRGSRMLKFRWDACRPEGTSASAFVAGCYIRVQVTPRQTVASSSRVM